MEASKTGALVLAAIVVCCIATIGVVAYLIQNDVQMVFPRKAHGEFRQAPKLAVESQKASITWILGQKCDYNAYEAQEVGYKPDSDMFWGGQGASCTEAESEFLCRANIHPAMTGGGEWRVQATGYGCTDGAYFVSEPMTISF
ncbi:hypothetical protein M0Q28_01215 [Patescibacteria group bacterium]|jgi:hypothetical protein|nr:hypothetical protein [Patescibacteria group bacterium]